MRNLYEKGPSKKQGRQNMTVTRIVIECFAKKHSNLKESSSDLCRIPRFAEHGLGNTALDGSGAYLRGGTKGP